MFYELLNHFSRLFAIIKEIMINDYFSYVNHHMKSNIVYFVIYLIDRQHNFILWQLYFIIFCISNEKEIYFTFLFFRLSVVFKQLIYIFYVYFINAFSCDFCIKIVYNLYFLLSTFVMHVIVIIFLIALIVFSCVIDDVSDSRRYIFSHSRELNST